MDLLQVGLSLAGVIGLIIMLFYALKKLNRRVSTANGNRMRVLDRINLGRDGMLLVVSVEGKMMLIGVTAQNITLLTELHGSEKDYPGFSESVSGTAPSFGKILENIMHSNKKESGNNDEKK